MTLDQAIKSCRANSAQMQEVGHFSKSFRSSELSNIVEGEEFTIPEDYVIFSQKIMRGQEPATDRDGNIVTAEFINVVTNTGRNVRFFPTSLSKIAFRVDAETGKDLVGAENRIVRTSGSVAKFVDGREIDSTMQDLKGCTIKCVKLEKVPVRAFGVSNASATKNDVQMNSIGTWELAEGSKKPVGWVE